MTLYKVTNIDGSACHGGHGRWTLGKWRSVTGPLLACQRGLHVCRADQLVAWLGPAIWEAETEGEVLDAGDKLVARKARVVRRIEAWNERTARLFAADCAEHILPLFEAERPDDDRPRTAIEVARRFANGEATQAELAAAWDAAGDAARAAARAAWDAARAARDAARAAAWDAAWDAARAAARDAAGAAAGAAARAAAGDAARAAELQWQQDRLFDYLEGRA